MGKVWELIAARHGGIPQPRLAEKGKKWAPRSLLEMNHGNSDSPGTRIVRWMDPALGIPSADGLIVKFPGIKLDVRVPDDNMIQNPWKSIPQIPETRLIFTSQFDGERYEIDCPAHLEAHANHFKTEAQAREPFLHNLVHSGTWALILLGKPTQEPNWTGLLVRIIKNVNGVLHVEHKCHINLSGVLPAQKLLYDTAERLARSLRQEPIIANVARLMSRSGSGSESEEESDEYKAGVEER
jgi:hypothetical protein